MLHEGRDKFAVHDRTSPLIRNLFKGIDSRSAHFISNLRSYNNMFAFMSLGGKVESEGNDGSGCNAHFDYLII